MNNIRLLEYFRGLSIKILYKYNDLLLYLLGKEILRDGEMNVEERL